MITFPTYRFEGPVMFRRPRHERASHELRVRITHLRPPRLQILRWRRRRPRLLLHPHPSHAEIDLLLLLLARRTRGNVGSVVVLNFALMCLKGGVVIIVFMSMVRCNLSLPNPRVPEEWGLGGWGGCWWSGILFGFGKLFKVFSAH